MHLSTLVEIAADLRRRAGQLTPPFSTHRIIETALPEALVTGAQLPAGLDEVVSRRDGKPIIVYQRKLSAPEQRNAIAHGFAHVLFDDFQIGRMKPGCAGHPRIEARADLFAAELLAPLASVRRFARRRPATGEEHELYLDHVDEIASIFGMPADVIDLQIRRLDVTDKIASHL